MASVVLTDKNQESPRIQFRRCSPFVHNYPLQWWLLQCRKLLPKALNT